jgi:P4 family phage/plasmid primase-like protien
MDTSLKNKYSGIEDFKHKNKTVLKSKTETHQSFEGEFRTNFRVLPEENEFFLNLYIKSLKKGNKSPILEKSQEVGPLYYDFDIKHNTNKIFYTIDDLRKLSLKIMKIIKKYYNIEENDNNTENSDNSTEKSNNQKVDLLTACILYKKEPSFKESTGEYSSGFHIHYPYTHANYKDRLFIFEKICDELKNYDMIVKMIEKIGTDFNKLIDSSVIKNDKWWYLYGSGKIINNEMYDYKLQLMIDSNNNEIEKPSINSLVKILSVIKYNATINLTVKQKYAKDFENFNKNIDNKKSVSSKYFEEAEHDEENNVVDNSNILVEEKKKIEMARKLLSMLDPKRSENYTEWSCICCALCSISKYLKSSFHEFSKICPSKYNKNECEKKWIESSENVNSGFGMHSLKGWARKDNYNEYLKFKNEYTMDLLDNVINLKAEYDIAEIIYFIYRDEFVCVGIKQNMWYHFNGVVWIENKEAYTLSNKLSKEFALECAKRSMYYMAKSISIDGSEADKYLNKKKIMDALSVNMRGSYKNNIISQSKTLFYDNEFIKKLNDDDYLVGFKNGVYDLNKRIFRKSHPEDYISFTVGYNYPSNISDESKDDVENFLKSIMPDEEELTYLMCYIASILEGGNKNQIFMVWTGSGSNGKGTLTELIDNAFGDYYSTVDVSLLTQSRGNSSSANPQIADKVGKRCLFVSEPDDGAKIQASYMKSLTGQDKIQSRALYQDPFYYYPKFKLCLQCNDLPEIVSIDGGTWRRIRVLFFGQKFVENPKLPNEKPLDPSLRIKIKQWGPVLMYLLINKYYPIYAEKGLTKLEPLSVKNATLTYKENSDSYSEYLGFYEKSDSKNDIVMVDELWASYSEWLKKTYPGSKLSSCRKLTSYLELCGYTLNKNKQKILFLKRKIEEDN